VWIPLLFGRAYEPATLSLRLHAPIFVLSYLCMLSAICLILLDRAWHLAFISVAALAVNPILNLILVPAGARLLGPGGAAAGSALALLLTEAGVTLAMTAALRAETFDAHGARAIGKAIVVAALVVVLDRALRRLGPARLLADAAVYAALLPATGAVRLADLRDLLHTVLREGRRHASA
jgi:O-antigen/teichoic acid export membrane protein